MGRRCGEGARAISSRASRSKLPSAAGWIKSNVRSKDHPAAAATRDYGFFSSTAFFASVAPAIIESRLALNSVPGFHVGMVFA